MNRNTLRLCNAGLFLALSGMPSLAHALTGPALVHGTAVFTFNAREDHFEMKDIKNADHKTETVFSRDRTEVKGDFKLSMGDQVIASSPIRPDLSSLPFVISIDKNQQFLAKFTTAQGESMRVNLALSGPSGCYVFPSDTRTSLLAKSERQLSDSAAAAAKKIAEQNTEVSRLVNPAKGFTVESVVDSRSRDSDECLKMSDVKGEAALIMTHKPYTVTITGYFQTYSDN